MAKGAANWNANGTDLAETLVSSIRPGMKREFAMMIKSQRGFEIEIGQRRTRSQNSASDNKNAASRNDEVYWGNQYKRRSKGSSENKAKKEVAAEGVKGEEEKLEEVAGLVGLEGNGSGNNGEKEALLSEEEEPKSDVVDCNSDDELKGNVVEEGMAEGEEKEDEVLELERLGSQMEIMSDTVKNANRIEIDSGKAVVADYTKDAVFEEPMDGVVEGMNEDLQVVKEVIVPMDSDYEVGNVVETPELGDKVGLTMSALDVGRNAQKPLRRFTRSLLKPTVEASVTEDVKGEEAMRNDGISPGPTSSKMEMKMSKKFELTKTPTKLKELLETGLLEGVTVQYIRGARVRGPGETGLRGVIQGSEILCFCNLCKGTKAVKPNQFEIHAGSTNKRPPEYIYLENGKTLRDVLNACKGVCSDSLELVIRQTAGCIAEKVAEQPIESKRRSVSEESVQCLNCKGCMPNDFHESYPLCDACMTIASKELSANQLDDTSTRSLLNSRSKTPLSSSRSQVQGRLTRKDLRLHRLVFESDLLPNGTALAYFSGAKKLLSGHKLGHGIFCDCCREVVSPSNFECHAGFGTRRKPYLHIFTSNGVSLHELSLEIKKTMVSSTDENDDVCSVCEKMGNLLCCDNCPRAFHQGCLGLEMVPQGKWYCKYCENMIEKEKHADRNVNAVAAGRVAGIDPFEEIKKRCIRILDTVEHEDGGCVLCRGHLFTESESGFGPLTVMICDQCENEYHVGCLKKHGMDDLKELPEGKWFCRSECRNIHSALSKLVADGEHRLPHSMLEIIKEKFEEDSFQANSDQNISWRVLHGKTASKEDRKWLADAVSVFHDRFDPIAVNSTQDDLIPFMIDGRSNKEQDFGGIYCAILVVNTVVVSAGIFRVFGQEVAEIPLVATSNDCQGKGYFQSLFNCIEDFLASLNVRNLVLPAAPEARSIWMNKFGFEKIADKQLNEYRKDYPVMVFQGTTILHKAVRKI